MTQGEMFPRTTLELLVELAVIHRAEYDKATKALDGLSDDEQIAKAYKKAEDRVSRARRLVDAINQVAKRERERLTTTGSARSITEEAADIVNSGVLDHDGTTVTARVTPADFTDEVAAELDAHGVEYQRDKPLPAVDPITGEVASVPAADWECPTCRGDGRIPDKTGGGHHGTCKTCDGTGHAKPSCDNCTGYGDCNISQPSGSDTMGCGGRSWLHGEMMGKAAEPYVSVVVVLYPGSDEPVVTEIGEKTKYGQLVADYFTAAAPYGKHSAKDWSVVAEDEITTTGGLRELRDVIAGADYGKRLLVVAADQGSVTGVEEGSET